ncbi:MAG: hypothetical protein FWG34_07145 [Oscillospiraceae bacterium]|nr:hypothetical protein [Oscillospiraceae bacterium]
MKKIGGNDDFGEMRHVSPRYAIKAENIDLGNYFLSLADNALDAGLLSEKDMDAIQAQIYGILSDNIWIYTKGTSTSVTSKEANELAAAILHALDSFCISETGKDITAADEPKLIALVDMFKKKGGIKNCYGKGLAVLGKSSAAEIAPELSAKKSAEGMRLCEQLLKAIDFEELDRLDKDMNSKKDRIISESLMTDEEFNRLYEKILTCGDGGKKAGIIVGAVSSAADFLDILESQCLFGEEYLALYEKLSKESPEALAFLSESAESREEGEWQECLKEFMGKLPN